MRKLAWAVVGVGWLVVGAGWAACTEASDPADAGADSAVADGGGDATVAEASGGDVPGDAPMPDAVAVEDTGPLDVPAVTPDAVADAGHDTTSLPDAPPDTAVDTVADAAIDTSEDAAADTAADAVPDALDDALDDVSADSGFDAAPDSASDSTLDADTGPPACGATVEVTAPIQRDFLVSTHPLLVQALVTDASAADLSVYSVDWLDEQGSLLANSPVAADGTTSLTLTGLTPGKRALRPIARDSVGPCAEHGVLEVAVCALEVSEDFDAALPPAWTLFGDASWDVGGFLEMTGNAMDRRGAVYNGEEYISSGTVSIRFDIQTGGGSGSGADGFAVSIVETATLAELQGLLPGMTNGGGLGYGSGGDYGPYEGSAFTVEIDTWYNQYNGNTELHSDPTTADHLEVTGGLDPAASIAWFELGEVEDLAWHQVRVDIVEPRLRVWYDGDLKIDEDIQGLKFRGGYILFTGSTGYFTNYHRFDRLRLIHACEPETE